MIDTVSLADTMTRLCQAAKVANASLAQLMTAEPKARSNTTLSTTNNQIWNLTDAQIQEAAALYPVNAIFGSASPNSQFLTN